MKKIGSAFSFGGTAKRADYLRFIPIALIIWLAAGFIDEQFLAPNLCLINENWFCYLPGEVREGWTLDKIVALLLLIPFFAVSVRRLNRHGKPSFLVMLVFPALAVLWFWVYRPAEPLPWYAAPAALLVAAPYFYWMLMKAKGKKGKKKSRSTDEIGGS